jgi:hypothetical protein
MAEIFFFEAQNMGAHTQRPRSPSPPRLHDDVRTSASLFAAGCSVLLTALCFGLAVLLMAVLRYDGAFLGAGSDGLCLGAHACSSAGAVHLSLLSSGQRAAIATALVLSGAPALMILAHLRGLFRLYAAGIVFAGDNIAQISRAGSWLLVYSAAPFLTHWLLDAYAIFPGQSWFHPDEAAAAIIGLSLLLVARVIAAGHEIEQRRDLFI